MQCQLCLCPKHDWQVLGKKAPVQEELLWNCLCVAADAAALPQQRIRNSCPHCPKKRIRASPPPARNSSEMPRTWQSMKCILEWSILSSTPKRLKSSDEPLPSMWHVRWPIFLYVNHFQISVFLPVWFSCVNHLPPDISRPWEADPGERRGGRKRFYPNTISRLNLEFPVLNKMKVSTKESRGVVRMGEICPHPPLTARQMLMVGLLWWLRILDPARVTPLTINQWITVGPIVSGEDSVIWIQPALFSTYCWWSLLDPLCCVI